MSYWWWPLSQTKDIGVAIFLWYPEKCDARRELYSRHSVDDYNSRVDEKDLLGDLGSGA